MGASLAEINSASVAAELRGALTRARLPAYRFAAHLGTSSSRMSTYLSGKVTPSATFYLRAMRLGEAYAELHRHRWPTPDETARAITASLDQHQGDPDPLDWPLRTALYGRDALRSALEMDSPAVLAWATAAPITTGRAEWDALLAALAAHEFERAHQSAPTWVQERTLSTPWTAPHPWLTAEEVIERSPSWLSRFGIHMPARDLTTA